MNMLEYQKNILEKVSFSPELFIKEFKKSLQWIEPSDFSELLSWVFRNFNKYYHIISHHLLSTDQDSFLELNVSRDTFLLLQKEYVNQKHPKKDIQYQN